MILGDPRQRDLQRNFCHFCLVEWWWGRGKGDPLCSPLENGHDDADLSGVPGESSDVSQ